jgi:chromosome partitioning protein
VKIVTVFNYKGGVGKTTLTVNLGAELARRGMRVLLLDLDPQSSLTLSLIDYEDWDRKIRTGMTFRHWIDSRRRGRIPDLLPFVTAPEETARHLRNAGQLDLVGADLLLSDREEALYFELDSATPPRSRYLEVFSHVHDALETARPGGYDLVLIDCAPNFGALTRSAVIASDAVLAPARADRLSLYAISHLRERINRLQAEYDRQAGPIAERRGMPGRLESTVLGVVITMARHSGQKLIQSQRGIVAEINDIYPVFDTKIWDRPKPYGGAEGRPLPTVLRDAASPDVISVWRALASEFTKRLGGI